ncbi:MAG: sensor histidine kinase [Pseudomonadota bacterium]
MRKLTGKLSLRWRLILAMVIMVTASTALFSTGVVLIKNRLEAVTFGELVSDQMDVILNQSAQGIAFDQEQLPNWQLFRSSDRQPVPDTIRSLSRGSHHSVRVDDHFYQVEVRPTPDGETAWLLYDITEWESQEHALLVMTLYGSLFVLGLAILLGLGVARAVLAPLERLTARLHHVQPDQRRVRISQDFTGEEVHQIASAFDLYQERIDRFVERETFFTAAASHELRTPLSIIIGATDILEALPDQDPRRQRAVERIQRACTDMRGFVEVALLLAREEQQAIPDEHYTSIHSVTGRVLDDRRQELVMRGMGLHCHFEQDICVPQAAGVITIIIGNLVSNAIEHGGGGTLSIRQQGNCLSISDTGAGIPTEHLPRVFDRDFTTRSDGTGMGLNLVRRLCERFGWTIDLESTPGKGTTVTLDFSATAIPCTDSSAQ